MRKIKVTALVMAAAFTVSSHVYSNEHPNLIMTKSGVEKMKRVLQYHRTCTQMNTLT